MGILGSLKRAFGLGSSEYDYDTDAFSVDATVTPLSRNENTLSTAETQTDSAETESTNTIAPVPVDSIFNTVVDIFNQAMPSFLGDAANSNVQREKLYQALDEDIKQYIADLGKKASEECEIKWRKQRHSLEQEVKDLKTRLMTMEESGSEKGKELLSAQRQKRAMNERIHDLENQITQLEAEKEQYELENRSLVNKLRVSNIVNDGSSDTDTNHSEYEARILELQNQINELNTGKSQLTENNATLNEKNSILTNEIATANSQIQNLNEQLEVMRIKTGMTDVMINDLNNRVSTSMQEINERESRIEELTRSLEDLKQSHEETLAELAEANSNLEIAEQIHTEIDKVHELLGRKNNQIAQLTLDLKHRDERINALEAEEASLRHTIESNLIDRATKEQALNEEIQQLKQKTASTSREKKTVRKRTTPHISAIDEDLDNTDWLIATPPAGTNAKTSGVTDSEFGYQEPDRKTPPENSAQMSLW